jgi:AraC-like DNA-binding protein/mannose-6-phosphate isomerase-like protein (cupin superfamily)
MNPGYLFSLSDAKRARYHNQPDLAQGRQIVEPEEYEHPSFVENAALRFWYNDQPDRYMTHWHNATEMITVLECGYTVTVQNQIFHLEPGDILVVPPGALHSIQGNPKGEGARFVFLFELTPFTSLPDFRFVRSAFSGAVLINQMTCPDIYEEEITAIMQCADIYWSESPIRLLRIYSTLLQFLTRYTELSLSGRIKQTSSTSAFKNSTNSTNNTNSTEIQSLLSKIEADCKHIPSLEEAATQTGLSKFYFSRQFRSCTGRTYWDYISQIRLKKASQLLSETNDAICKIALACGFHDLSSFNRSFKKNMGCTPGEYRAQNKLH